MSNKTPTSSGKKLVQARLPFQVFRKPPHENEQTRKKLIYVDPIDDCENVKDIKTKPLVSLSGDENSPVKNSKPEMVELHHNTEFGVKSISCDGVKPKIDKMEVIEIVEIDKPRKRSISNENGGVLAKKLKLDSMEKLKKFEVCGKTVENSSCTTTISSYFPTLLKVVPVDNEGEELEDKIELIDSVEAVYSDDTDEGALDESLSPQNSKKDSKPSISALNDLNGPEVENNDDVKKSVFNDSNISEVENSDNGLLKKPEDQYPEIPVLNDSSASDVSIPTFDLVDSTATVIKKIKTKTPRQLEKEKEMAKKREERQLEREKEMAKKREEREREKDKIRQEKETKRLQEKEEKQKLKEEKEMQKKKELELKEELKKKAKEEKEKKRQEEIDRKEEERKRREEEEAQAKNKFAKEAKVFSTFFKKVEPECKKSEAVVEVAEKTESFIPFAVKSDMRLAPLNRNPMTSSRRAFLDEQLIRQAVDETYLTELRCGDIKPGYSSNTWPLDQIFQDDEIAELPITNQTDPKKPVGPRPKLLQFKENRRPPYWGTWRKRCPQITARRPFGMYKEFEYDVDSDEEWEEEEPGESLHGSDDEKEKDEDGEDYEVDNEFFVPHGYLSEDEVADEHWSVEQQKEKLKLLGEQFDKERNEKTKQLRPVVIGCVWSPDASQSENKQILEVLERFRPLPGHDTQFPIEVGNGGEDHYESCEVSPPASSVKGRVPVPEEAVPALLAQVHGSMVRRRAIAKSFSAFWATEHPESPILTLAAISRRVRDLAQWIECPEPPIAPRMCWYVPLEVRQQYGCADLPLLTPVHKVKEQKEVLTGAATPPVEADISLPKITKFTKVLSEDERRKSLMRPTPPVASPDECLIIDTPSPIVEKAVQKLFRFKVPPPTAVQTSTPLQTAVKTSTPLQTAVKTSTPLQTAVQTSTPLQPVQVKKRVSILFSSPLGVPIDKTKGAVNVVKLPSTPDSNATICLSSDTDDPPSSQDETIPYDLQVENQGKNEAEINGESPQAGQNKLEGKKVVLENLNDNNVPSGDIEMVDVS